MLDAMISVDNFLNETSRHAHVILPGLSPLEESHYDVAFPQLAYRNAVRYSTPVFERSAGVDGWVSLEVSPLLAHDTASTVAQAA